MANELSRGRPVRLIDLGITRRRLPHRLASYVAEALERRTLLTNSPGLIFDADAGTGTIGEYTTAGATVDASLVSGLSSPSGLVVSGSDLFVTDYTDPGSIGEYTTSGLAVNASLVAGLANPFQLAISGSDLFVLNVGTGTSETIGEYTTSGATVNASLITGLQGVVDIAVSGSDLFVVNESAGAIAEYTTTGELLNGSLISTESGPTAVVVSGDDIFVATEGSNSLVSEYTTSGSTVSDPLISTSLQGAVDLSMYGSDLFVAEGVSPGGPNSPIGTEIDEYTTSGTPVSVPFLSGFTDLGALAVEPQPPSTPAPTPTSTTPGSTDPTFNNGNPVSVGFAAQASATQADGSVLLAGLEPGASAGSTQAALEQLNADGSFNANFGSGGTVTESATSDEAFYGVTTESDGTIVAAGTSDGDLLMAAYNSDGSIDTPFGTGGLVRVPIPDASDATAYGIATDANGDIVVVGSAAGQFLADRFTAAGAQDATFNGGSPLLFGAASDGDVLGKAAVQSNGGIVAAGASDGSVAVVRLTSAGALDPTFGTAGTVSLSQLAAPDLLPGQPDHTEGLTIDSEGRILVANTSPGGDFATARLTPAGVLDSTFSGGVVTTGFGSGTADADFVAVQPDNSQVLVAGTYALDGVVQQAIAAYTPQGLLDTTFGTNGMELLSTGLSAAPALARPSGKIAPQALGLAGLYIEQIFGNLESGKLLLGVGQQSSSTAATAAIQRLIALAPTATSLPVGTLTATISAVLPVGTIVDGAKTKATALVTVGNPTSRTISGPAVVTLLASLGQSLGSAIQLLAVTEKLKLKPGARKALRITLPTFPTSLPKGSYYLIAMVKAPDNSVTGASVATPSLNAVPALVTFKISNVFGLPAGIAPGKKLTLSLTLQNNGNVPAAGTAPLTISLSTNSSGAGGTTVATTRLRAKLNAGKSGVYRVKFVVPAATAAGNYYLAASLAVSALGDAIAADGMAVSGMPITVT